jgi:hypothetical protein
MTKVYQLGGKTYSGMYFNDLWETYDGENWTKTADLPFTTGDYPALCYHNGNLFVLPSSTSTTLWKSLDKGKTWSQVVTNSIFAHGDVRYSELVSFNGSLFYVVNTTNGSTYDLYKSSDDGLTWISILNFTLAGTNNAKFSIVNNVLYLVMGIKGYKSTDGVTFTSVSLTNMVSTQESNLLPFDVANILYDSGSLGKIDTTHYVLEKYNITTNTVTTDNFINLGSSLTGTKIAQFGSFIYVFGGTTSTTASVEVNNWRKYNSTGFISLQASGTCAFSPRYNTAIAITDETQVTPPSDLTGGSSVQIISNTNISGNVKTIEFRVCSYVSDITQVTTQAIVETPLTDLQISAIIAEVSTVSAKAIVFDTKINGYTQTIDVTSKVATKANVFDAEIKANASISDTSQLNTMGEIIDPSTLIIRLTNIVKNNGIPVQNAKVIAVRDSDNKLYSTVTNSNGEWTLNVVAGTYHITCVYEDGSNNLFGLVKPYVVVQ